MIIGDFSNILVPVLTVVDVLVMAGLCLVVMMQRPKQEGLGAAFGSSMTDQMFGARTTDVLEKATRNLAIVFIIVTVALGIVVNRSLSTNSLIAVPVATEEVDVQPSDVNFVDDAAADESIDASATEVVEMIKEELESAKDEVATEEVVPAEVAEPTADK